MSLYTGWISIRFECEEPRAVLPSIRMRIIKKLKNDRKLEKLEKEMSYSVKCSIAYWVFCGVKFSGW